MFLKILIINNFVIFHTCFKKYNIKYIVTDLLENINLLKQFFYYTFYIQKYIFLRDL